MSLLSKLESLVSEASEHLDRIHYSIDELRNAEAELEDYKEAIEQTISALEIIDGLSVNVSVDSLDVDLTVEL